MDKKKVAKEAKKEEIKKYNELVLSLKIIIPVVLAVLIFVCYKLIAGTYKMTDINVERYSKLIEAKRQSLVFVTSNECNECDSTKKLLNKMLQGSKIKTYELNIDTLSNEEKDEFMAKFEETKSGVTAPSLLIVKNNELVSFFYGPFDEDLVVSYLQDNSLVRQTKTSDNNE